MREPVDRARFSTPEFKERLRKDAEAAANDPEYQAEIALWDVCVGDGLEEDDQAT